MSLIKSISGIRGTIGGFCGDGLSPLDIVKFTSAYSKWVRLNSTKKTNIIVVGRDARVSGEMVYQLVSGSLTAMGFDVLNIKFATTPTTELAVTMNDAEGGIIITASHNPGNWNALKLLNENGEFLTADDGNFVLKTADEGSYEFVGVDSLGKITNDNTMLVEHIDSVLKLNLVNIPAIRKAGFRVVVDCVNSVGGIAVPALLRSLGVKNIVEMNCEPTGIFTHNPEPVPGNLTGISDFMKKEKADVGFVVDPDVDRLAIICENGDMFVEEYTLVSVADYVLSHTNGNTVSNLSSSRALKDITLKHGGKYAASAVGEVNVVKAMKDTNAVIGGEGNGGVIYPESHYGRDALVGIALFLSLLAEKGITVSELKKTYPSYYIYKDKMELTSGTDVDAILDAVKNHFSDAHVNDIDGVKIDFSEKWVHLRKSNTEPIIRIYSEAKTEKEAIELAFEMKKIIDSI